MSIKNLEKVRKSVKGSVVGTNSVNAVKAELCNLTF